MCVLDYNKNVGGVDLNDKMTGMDRSRKTHRWPHRLYRKGIEIVKAIEIEIAFFHPLGNPKGLTLDHFFYASHIHHNFPYKLIPVSMN